METDDPIQYLVDCRQATANTAVRVHEFFTNGHLENTTVPLLECRSDSEPFLDRGRQTGGWSKETSLDAVGDLHIGPLARLVGTAHLQSPFAENATEMDWPLDS